MGGATHIKKAPAGGNKTLYRTTRPRTVKPASLRGGPIRNQIVPRVGLVTSAGSLPEQRHQGLHDPLVPPRHSKPFDLPAIPVHFQAGDLDNERRRLLAMRSGGKSLPHPNE